MDQIVFLWHQAQLPENLGAVARAMGNFSLTELRLIAPLCSPTDEKAIATSAGAHWILDNTKTFSSFEDATADIQWLYGTCATVRHLIKSYAPISVIAPEIIRKSTGSKIGILFGPERTGLDNDLLARCHEIIQIPVDPTFSSLNIAQACIVIGYELYKNNLATDPQRFFHYGETSPASQAQLQSFLSALEEKLDQEDHWRVNSKKPIMWRNLQNIFTRLHLTQQDLQTLRGIFFSKSQKS